MKLTKQNKKLKNNNVATKNKQNVNKGDFKKGLVDLAKYVKSHTFAIVVAIVLAITSTIFVIIGPDKIGEITEIIVSGLITGIDLNALQKVALFLLTIYLASAILSYVQGFIMSGVSQKVSRKMRLDISNKINVLPLKYFDSTTHGEVIDKMSNSVDIIGSSLNQSFVSIISNTVLVVGVLVMMFVTNWIMALTAVGATLIGFVLMGVIMGKSQKYFVNQQKSTAKMNGHIEEMFSSHNVVKAYNAEEMATDKFNEINQDIYKNGWKAQFISGIMMPLMNFIGNFGFVAVCVVGGVLAVSGKTTIDVIASFMIYVRLFTGPLGQLAQAGSTLQTTSAASNRVFEILHQRELEDESHKTKTLQNIKGNVEFKNVVFGYDENKTIIKNFSAKAKSGQKIAIVGPTGAGKTTMVNLLMRFYEINSGDILIDGVSIKDIRRENVNDLFAMVLQDTWMFEGTIAENIAYNRTNITREQIVDACKSIGLHHFIKTLPQGYDTVINDKVSLSSGQKQLITIARAMLKNAPMLILDEATSSVDTRLELLIQQAMDKLMQGRTSFVIAHRLSTIKNADLILVINNGDIVESGNHEELIEKDGFYADLYNSQFINN